MHPLYWPSILGQSMDETGHGLVHHIHPKAGLGDGAEVADRIESIRSCYF